MATLLRSLTLCLALALTLTACGGDGESGTGRPLDQTPLRPTWEREEGEA